MTALHAARELADAAAEKLKAYAQPQRLMILSLLLEQGEQPVSAIDEATGIGQPALSQQLAELRRSGLVSTRKQARQVYYSLADSGTELCVRGIEAVFGAGDLSGLSSNPVNRDLSGETPEGAQGAAHFARILSG
ncbi:ArsR/SmtB family transcription factor [Novosphingobium album (ex Liu et al. 2023)]|uniref:Metalloregulator ArsR/SmtB family transcription factor n=1 Tax=Novosphingobium album (ex Liu et al. 2023) TaxID=3031130 RepID=A0ABT5WMZ9_9SPHN|nr:metalloregulator ArsR/SmtB family transcription factor [Novosphingobium album (ex Liu et al. 2023)]MDE8650652.1 metalloregulator ArsR/SmtB family transcription factor [Novosphingobium album (ex Liu et al. 2023)]